MSASPSIPPSGPSLAQVLMKRMFARPPGPFVDGDLMKALQHAEDDGAPVPVDPQREPVKGQRIDVRV